MRERYSDFIRGSYWVSAIDHLARGLGDADLLVAVDPEADAGRLAGRIDDGDVGDVHRGFLGLDAALGVCLARLGVALDEVEADPQGGIKTKEAPVHEIGRAHD